MKYIKSDILFDIAKSEFSSFAMANIIVFQSALFRI